MFKKFLLFLLVALNFLFAMTPEQIKELHRPKQRKHSPAARHSV
ncbi:hypothetical protein [Campylobacter showae]|nr:hypothetical protein [Campylobacter showae]